MKQRWIARSRTILVVSMLAWGAAVVPAEATAAETGSASHGSYRHLGRGKQKQHQRQGGGGGEARAKGRASSSHAGAGAKRDNKLICDAAFEKAKEVAQSPVHIKAAGEWFAECAQPICAISMRKRCAVVSSRIAAMVPSVVPVVTDGTGAAISDVQVRMDGAVLTANLDGTAIPVDPGDHQFTFAKDGEVFAIRSLSLEKGQQHQFVTAALPRRPEAPAPDERVAAERPAPAPALPRNARPAAPAVPVAQAAAESEPADEYPAPTLLRRERRARQEAAAKRGAPWSAYALAGVGLLGVGGYGVLNLKGSAENDALVAFCKPDCQPTAVRHVRNIYLAADISLGVGLIALAGSTYLFFNHDGPAPEDNPRALRSHISQVSIEPTAAGAVATVAGTF